MFVEPIFDASTNIHDGIPGNIFTNGINSGSMIETMIRVVTSGTFAVVLFDTIVQIIVCKKSGMYNISFERTRRALFNVGKCIQNSSSRTYQFVDFAGRLTSNVSTSHLIPIVQSLEEHRSHEEY
uniref:Uncharacterized protein n=1 Tax=Romanomermis culicivorax TaxID=13658 RepID=A0A915HUQ8_ROMCU